MPVRCAASRRRCLRGSARRLPSRSRCRSASPPERICHIAYTSGTTARPKGVMLSNRSVHAGTVAMGHELGSHPDAVFLACTPLFHVGSAGRFSCTYPRRHARPGAQVRRRTRSSQPSTAPRRRTASWCRPMIRMVARPRGATAAKHPAAHPLRSRPDAARAAARGARRARLRVRQRLRHPRRRWASPF